MEYLNEHLMPGRLGHFWAVLSFVAALLSAVAYFMATQRRQRQIEAAGWLNIGRWSFGVHSLAVLGVMACLFYILVNKYYEYHYAWANVSDDLPFRYTFSAFWKEQQGSFLLWSCWHVVLGAVLLRRRGAWEAPVLAVVMLAEVFISSMILGLYFGEFRLGASPFDLMRQVMDAPIFAQPDYVSKISGQGLNPLLQNYWMTIHPPTLFLGFASTVVPCAFAIAGLWTGEHRTWLQPALRWSLFSAAILGLGILMGGAWAYEALSFGGYWAWDPVENASLVPWLTLVAGVHTNLVARATGHSIRSTYIFYILTFVLILYSTYLTRSGILGDTSAHAFTEMGLEVQLIAFILCFFILGKALLLRRWSSIPAMESEEASASREFWMFIGAMVLLFSAVLITAATSLPVFNKMVQIFNPDYKGIAIADPVEHHNRYQLWIAVFIGIFSAIAQWLRYGESNFSVRRKKISLQLVVAAALAGVLSWLNGLWLKNVQWFHFVMLLAAMFTVVSNLQYLFVFVRGNMKMAGSVLSHVGFGLLALGILSTGLNKEWISRNEFVMDGLIEGFQREDLKRNVLLLRESPMPLRGGLTAEYLGDTLERQTRTFTVRFERHDPQGNPTGEYFLLHPNVMYDRQFSKVVASNPDTKHYLTYDIFTHVSSLPKAELDADFRKQMEDSLKFLKYTARIGDTIFTPKHYLIVEGLTALPRHREYHKDPADITAGLKVRVHSLDEVKAYSATPFILIRPGEGGFNVDDRIGQLAMRLRLPDEAGPAMLALESFNLKKGETTTFNGNTVRLVDLNKNATHPLYQAQPNDIAVVAVLEITTPEGQSATARPLFCIRDGAVLSYPVFLEESGLTLRFERINPATETFGITLAQPRRNTGDIPILIAENGVRSDYIVLEAIVFPGINWVWLGSLLMLLGLALGWWVRRQQY